LQFAAKILHLEEPICEIVGNLYSYKIKNIHVRLQYFNLLLKHIKDYDNSKKQLKYEVIENSTSSNAIIVVIEIPGINIENVELYEGNIRLRVKASESEGIIFSNRREVITTLDISKYSPSKILDYIVLNGVLTVNLEKFIN